MLRNRTEAGRALAAELSALFAENPGLAEAPVVLALPRGGVPVAFEIARALNAPLDLVLVRKIGVPFQPELAAGAIVDGDEPQVVLNEDVIRLAGLRKDDLEPVMRRELEVIDGRRALYLGGRARAAIEGATAIVVDDGIATGATTRAALKALRLRKPSALVLAVPVAPQETLDELRGEVDRLVCLDTPSPFYAIGAHYLDFGQVSDAEVVRLLDEAHRAFEGAGRSGGGGRPGA